MKILGERVLVKRIEKEQTDSFQTVDVIDEFVSRGRIVQLGESLTGNTSSYHTDFTPGKEIIFAKFSPDTQEIKVDGELMKVVAISDIIAIV